jgi:hypothetical protein
MPRVSRRSALAALGSSLAALAGCGGFQVESDEETSTDGGDGNQPTQTPVTADRAESQERQTGGTTESPTTTTTDLDLREANVVGVEIADEGSGDYRFDVTLYHDDDGENGYANWWQVETPDGDRLGRRDLLHAHSTAPFTRSETIPVPDDVACVVVRGHDQTHGYGGQAMTVAVPGGATRTIQQGSERQPVAASDCA